MHVDLLDQDETICTAAFYNISKLLNRFVSDEVELRRLKTSSYAGKSSVIHISTARIQHWRKSVLVVSLFGRGFPLLQKHTLHQKSSLALR